MSQTTVAKNSSKPARMIMAGGLTALVGWLTRKYAASRMEEALRILAIRDPKGGPSVESAIALGYIGLAMIIFGAALLVVGLVVLTRPLRDRRAARRLTKAESPATLPVSWTSVDR